MGHVSARARIARRVALASAVLCVTAVFVIPTTHAAERSDLHGTLGASARR